MGFFKSFGMGLLYFVLSPFILAASIVVGVFGIFNHIVQLIIMLVHFFKGEKLFPTYKEDLLATKKFQDNIDAKQIATQPQQPQQTFIQQNFYTNPNQPGTPNIPMSNTPFVAVDANGNPLNPQAIPANPQPQAIEMNLEEGNDNE